MLVLIVGPSGAGKDTLIDIARTAFAADPRFRFVRRVITRPAEAGGEDHEPMSDPAFAARSFALQWQAHGLHYGIPADIAEDLLRGRTVVANVSRSIIAQAADRFPTRVIVITAPPQILAQRLAERGRESAGDITQRLARDIPIPSSIQVERIINDQTPAQGADQLISALIRATVSVPPK